MSFVVVGWVGYRKVFESMSYLPIGTGDPQDTDIPGVWTTAVDSREGLAAVIEYKDADHLRAAIYYTLGHFENAAVLVVLDRESLGTERLHGLELRDLREFGIYECHVLGTALPLLAASEYFTYRKGNSSECFALIPLRFGLNGAVCQIKHLSELEEWGVLRWSSESIRVLDLNGLAENLHRFKQGEFAAWRFASDMLIDSAESRGYLDEVRAFGLKWWIEDLSSTNLPTSWDEMHRLLGPPGTAKMLLGPADMLVGAVKRQAGWPTYTWVPVRGAGLLWLEGLGVLEGRRISSNDREIGGFLNEVLKKLNQSSVEHTAPDNSEGYVGLPVLGWRNGGNGEKQEKLRRALSKMRYEDKLEGLTREDISVETAMSRFLTGSALNSVGIVLRGYKSAILSRPTT